MRHCRMDYEAIQPWPTKRPHIAKVNGKLEEIGSTALPGVDFADDADVQPIIPDDEPVFIVRAQDPVAAETVRDWASRALHAGADVALCERVRRWADEMERWATERGVTKAAPDVPEGALRP